MKIVRWMFCWLVIAALIPAVAHPSLASTVLTSTLTLTSANNGQTFNNYRISTTRGDCVVMNGVSNVTFQNSNIGPCAGRGIYLNGGSKNNVYDSYIHVEGASTACCDTRDGVYIYNDNGDTIQGNVIAYSESNIEALSFTGLSIIGNFLLNPQGLFPRGEQSQLEGSSVTETNNFLLSTPDSTLGPAIGTSNTATILMSQDSSGGRPSDSMSFYSTQSVLAANNYISGGVDASRPGSGGCQDSTGCGLILDSNKFTGPNNSTFENNILVNTGQCGINVGSGTNQVVTGNKVINLNDNGRGNVAIAVWNEYTPACGPVTLHSNIATTMRSGGVAAGYWNGGGCGTVACTNGYTTIADCNTLDGGSAVVAYNLLTPIMTKLPPPLIPPQPKNCVVTSPYSTQTSLPPCS